jgi:hypothetical protein
MENAQRHGVYVPALQDSWAPIAHLKPALLDLHGVILQLRMM